MTAPSTPAQTDPRPGAFGTLLRAHRLAARLTQEQLAERAALSLRAIQNLERGDRRPYPDTTARLLGALALAGAERDAFEQAARTRRQPRSEAPRALRVLNTPPHNLPAPLTACVGRAADLEALHREIRAARLVTLAGPGGAGKTRLAVQLALDLVQPSEDPPPFGDGVWLVELDAVSEPGFVPRAVAAVLGVHDERERPLEVTIAAALHHRHLLIVLDNCEHVLPASGELVETLLRGCPRVTILATSRQPLSLPGEIVREVGPLDLPDESDDAERLFRSPAMELFVERARAAAIDLAMTPDTAREMAAICRQLDGMPLALELAAARLRGLSVRDLSTHLDSPFGLLAGGAHRRSRHQSLRATIDWSYALLDVPQRRLARQLSVFSGGWTLGAAESVCGALATEGLVALVDHSLVQVDRRYASGARYRFLDTVRQYLREQLEDAGESAAAQDAHLRFFLEFAETTSAGLSGRDQVICLQRLDAEQANVRAALQWALGQRPADAALGLAASLATYWDLRGDWRVGLALLEHTLQLEPTDNRALHARVLLAAGRLALGMRNDQAVAWLEQSLTICRELGDHVGSVRALVQLGRARVDEADLSRATAALEEAVVRAEQIGDLYDLAAALGVLGQAILDRADHVESVRMLERSLDLTRRIDDRIGQANTLLQLAMAQLELGETGAAQTPLHEAQALFLDLGDAVGAAWTEHDLAYEVGDYAQAEGLFERSATLFQSLGYSTGVAHSLHNVGRARLALDDTDGALRLFDEALELFRRAGHQRGLAWGLYNLAWVAADRGDTARAWSLVHQAIQLFRAMHLAPGLAACFLTAARLTVNRQPQLAARWLAVADGLRHVSNVDRARGRRVSATAREALGETAYEAAWLTGGRLAGDAVDDEIETLLVTPRVRSTAARRPPLP